MIIKMAPYYNEPVDPYVQHAKGKKKGAQISALKGQQDSKSGVDLRWHTKEEYKTLSKAQRIELSEWQKSKAGKATINKQKSDSGYKPRQSAKSKLKAKIKALEAQVKQNPADPTDQPDPSVSVAEIQRVFAAVSSMQRDTSSTSTAEASAHALQSILKRKRTDTK